MIGSDVFHLRLSNLEIQAERILDPSIKGRSLAVISSHNQMESFYLYLRKL